MDEVANAIKDTIHNRRKSDAMFIDAKRRLQRLYSNFDDTWRRPEIYQYFNELDLYHANKAYETRAMTNAVKDKTVLSDAHTQEFGNSYCKRPENIHDKGSKQRRINTQSDSDIEDEEVSDHEVQVSKEEIFAGRTS
ncbi:hypothetical protein F8M41_017085 [Gigaspora margarita]|uniref:Uncharacterized protein n=1 Tax=Gigaspora margarita TaxID=4874 RepID=A0A8H3ZVD1_GIGMA|nr:hypothetical protein F8M41_017085 [Gigaspora margarita]